jgi:hypothetical protein
MIVVLGATRRVAHIAKIKSSEQNLIILHTTIAVMINAELVTSTGKQRL